MRALFSAIILLATFGRLATGQACGITVRTLVTDSGIGALRIGMPVALVRSQCRVVRDTIQTNDDYVESERVLYVDLGRDTVMAAVRDDRIDRIDIDGPVFHTADSLFAGMSLRRLLRKPGVTAAAGEASIQADVPGHCGLGVELSGAGPSKDEFEYTNDELRRWPPTIRVKKLWIYRCRMAEH
jgi:hypothetical protein